MQSAADFPCMESADFCTIKTGFFLIVFIITSWRTLSFLLLLLEVMTATSGALMVFELAVTLSSLSPSAEFLLRLRREKGPAPSRSNLDADNEGLWK